MLSDDTGPWLVIDDAAVEGSVFSLIANHVDFTKATAARVQVLKIPQSKNESSSLKIDIGVLDVPELETAPELSSQAMRFSAHGALHMQSIRDLAAYLSLTRVDGSGTYRANGTIAGGILNGTISVDEAPNGFITGLLRLNDIGAIKAEIRGEGPPEANSVRFVVDAGALHAAGLGTVNLREQNLDLDFSASAPAMDLRQDLSWQSASAEGHAHGKFDALALDMRLALAGLKANGVSATTITGTATGTTGEADFTADASGLEISGLDPKFFAGAPVSLRAHADLRTKERPLAFTLTHPLLNATGTASLDGARSLSANVTLPRLQPYGAIAGIDVAGRASFAAQISVSGTAHIALDGTLAISGGDPVLAAIVGQNAPFTFAADLDQGDLRSVRARLKGPKAEASVNGAIAGRVIDLAATGTVSDASIVVRDLKGAVSFNATAKGPFRTAKLDATVKGMVGTNDFAPQSVSLSLQASGLSKPASGTFKGESAYRYAPVLVSGSFGWNERGLHLAIESGQWKSVTLAGAIDVPPGVPFTATMMVHIADLADATPFVGTPISGALDGKLQWQRQRGEAILAVDATAHDIRMQDARIGTLAIAGNMLDPLASRRLALKLAGSGISASRFSGSATADMEGSLDALAIKTVGELKDQDGHAIKLDAAGTLRSKNGEVTLASLQADYRDIKASLLRPATVRFRDGIAVDRIALKSGDAELDISGRLTPALEADLTLQNISAQALKPYISNLSQGTLSGHAQLKGTLEAPQGSASFDGRNLRLVGLPPSLPDGTLDARADFKGGTAQLDASLAFGPSKLTITGEAPIASSERFNIHAAGTTDLAVLNAEFSAEGRRAIGHASLDASISGTRDSPSITGTLKLANAEFQDYPRGLRITAIAADGEFKGKTLEIAQ
ncbi:MAG TPA: hypothetical protein VEU06_06325, partial [Micropepsaceae bacterium]|nr:hypothetical protein [Micropepsaceae bacterium]